MYFLAPATVTGPFTITITAQLGAGAVASDWLVEMYSFLPENSDGYFSVGDLTGGKPLVPRIIRGTADCVVEAVSIDGQFP